MATVSSDERDAALWESIGGDPADLERNGAASTVEVPERAWEAILGRLDELEGRMETLEGNGYIPDEDDPTIEHYAAMPAEEWDQLDTSIQIAVTLHEQWQDLAWKLGGGRNYAGNSAEQRFGIDTKTKANVKYQPSKIRYELRRELDRDLQVNEIYRGMQRLAKLSGGTEHVDSRDDRVHITGGLYEYREQSTIDGKAIRRVLWRDEK